MYRKVKDSAKDSVTWGWDTASLKFRAGLKKTLGLYGNQDSSLRPGFTASPAA